MINDLDNPPVSSKVSRLRPGWPNGHFATSISLWIPVHQWAREINATFSGQPLDSARSLDISLLNSVRRSPPPPLHSSFFLSHYPGEHFGRYRREICLDLPPHPCFIPAKKERTNIETFGKYRDQSSFNRRKMFAFVTTRSSYFVLLYCEQCATYACT